jgi:hypothetical protein
MLLSVPPAGILAIGSANTQKAGCSTMGAADFLCEKKKEARMITGYLTKPISGL